MRKKEPAKVGYKVCSKCKDEKPLDDFFADNSRLDGKKSLCKDCCNNRDKGRKRNGNHPYSYYYHRRTKIYIAGGPIVAKTHYDKLYIVQKGLCAICGKPETARRLSVDHNHQTGQVRGLLCAHCNLWLGIVETPQFDDFIPLAKAYLAKQSQEREQES